MWFGGRVLTEHTRNPGFGSQHYKLPPTHKDKNFTSSIYFIRLTLKFQLNIIFKHQRHNQVLYRQCKEPKDKTNLCPKDSFYENGETREEGKSPYNTERKWLSARQKPKVLYREQSTSKEGESILRLMGKSREGKKRL